MTWLTRDDRLQTVTVVCITFACAVAPCNAHAQSKERVPVQLRVPANRAGCAGDDFFYREFHRALGVRLQDVTNSPVIDVQIDEIAPDLFQLLLQVTFADGKSEKSTETYGPPTECSKVVAYAADSAAELVLHFSPPTETKTETKTNTETQKPAPPIHQDKPFKAEYIGVGSALSYGLALPTWVYQPYAMVGLRLTKRTAVEGFVSGLLPYHWHGSSGTDVNVSFSMQAAVAACVRGDVLGACARLTVGGIDAQSSSLEHPKQDAGAVYVTVGADIFAEEPIGDTTSVRATIHAAGTTLTPAITTRNFSLWEASPIGVDFGVTVIRKF